MDHFVDDDVFEQIYGVLHQFRVQADVTAAVGATASARFHALQNVPFHLHAQLRFPFRNQRGHDFVQPRLCHAGMISARFSGLLPRHTVNVMRLG
jgi:hypothetical protein